MALALYRIKGIPLSADAAWFDAIGSGLLLFAVSGVIPILLLSIARVRGRAAGTAIRVHYVLTAMIGAALAYGAYTTGVS